MTSVISRSPSFQDSNQFRGNSNHDIHPKATACGRNVRTGKGTARFIATLAGALFLLVLMARSTPAQSSTTFKGTISDEHLNCMQNPMKVPPGVKDKTSCVLYWTNNVEPKGKYVLYDAETKTTYQLDDQGMVQPYVGAKMVEITGTLNPATKTIHVTGIKVPDYRGD